MKFRIVALLLLLLAGCTKSMPAPVPSPTPVAVIRPEPPSAQMVAHALAVLASFGDQPVIGQFLIDLKTRWDCTYIGDTAATSTKWLDRSMQSQQVAALKLVEKYGFENVGVARVLIPLNSRYRARLPNGHRVLAVWALSIAAKDC